MDASPFTRFGARGVEVERGLRKIRVSAPWGVPGRLRPWLVLGFRIAMFPSWLQSLFWLVCGQ